MPRVVWGQEHELGPGPRWSPAWIRLPSSRFTTPTHVDVTPASVVPDKASNDSQARSPRLQVVVKWGLWLQSLQVMGPLLVNAALSLIWSGIAIVCCASGNVLTLRSSSQQSYSEFLSGIMMWNMSFFCLIIVVTHVSLLIGKTFISTNDQPAQQRHRPATFSFCFSRVFRATARWILLWVLMIVGFVFAFDTVTHGAVRYLRLDYYISCILGWLFLSNVWLITRRIYQQETREGIERAAVLHHQGRQTLILSSVVIPVNTWSLRIRRFRRVLLRGAPTTVAMIIAGLYTQLSGLWRLRSQSDLFFFTAGSLVLKVAMQEIVKHIMLVGRIQDTRTMFLAVGMPTVLIDTQVRLILQLVQSSTTSVGGSVGLAVLEIFARWGKVYVLRFQIRRRDPFSQRTRQEATLRKRPCKRHQVRQAPPIRRTTTARRQDFESWRLRLLQFHAAEAYADMSAEYIAIACSAMILYTYGHHPKYQMLFSSTVGQWADASNANGGNQLHKMARVLGLQVLLEFAVDLFSCVLELSQGVDFNGLRRHRLYIAVTFIGIGVMNIQITAVMNLLY